MNTRDSRPAGSLIARLTQDQRWIVMLIALLAAELLYFSVAAPGFFGGGSGLLSLTEQFINIGVMALGVGFVIFAGDIDLSCGAMASFTGIVMAVLWKHGVEIWVAVAIALAVSALIGLLHGLIITLFRLESLLVTLASQFILGSVAAALGGGSPPYGFPHKFLSLVGTGTVGPVPTQLIEFAVLALIACVLMHRTAFGRGLVLLGHNRSAATYVGINVSWTRVRAFVLSGLFAGIAGILVAGFYNAARDDVGDALLLPAITTVVLGGVDIFGGRGHMFGVVVAAFALGFATQGLLIQGISQLTATMVTGGLLLVSLAVKLELERERGGALMQRLRIRSAREGPP